MSNFGQTAPPSCGIFFTNLTNLSREGCPPEGALVNREDGSSRVYISNEDETLDRRLEDRPDATVLHVSGEAD